MRIDNRRRKWQRGSFWENKKCEEKVEGKIFEFESDNRTIGH